jgi:hypothetical protein
MNAVEYNRRARERGELTDEQVADFVRYFQRAHGGLDVDGKAGPLTRAALERATEPATLRVIDGWLQGDGVLRLAADPSWFGDDMPAGPLAIVAHYTATAPGTGITMATRRIVRRGAEDRAASWHVTVAADGLIIQMVPFHAQAWHCARGVVPVPGGMMRPNACAIGIELEGHGQEFPAPQVAAACRVWRALVHAYAIPRTLSMFEHSVFDPERRDDPGPIWMQAHAPLVLDYAFR